jgi:hypothetical protein
LRQGLSVADAKLAIMTTQYYTASSIDGFIALFMADTDLTEPPPPHEE